MGAERRPRWTLGRQKEVRYQLPRPDHEDQRTRKSDHEDRIKIMRIREPGNQIMRSEEQGNQIMRIEDVMRIKQEMWIWKTRSCGSKNQEMWLTYYLSYLGKAQYFRIFSRTLKFDSPAFSQTKAIISAASNTSTAQHEAKRWRVHVPR